MPASKKRKAVPVDVPDAWPSHWKAEVSATRLADGRHMHQVMFDDQASKRRREAANTAASEDIGCERVMDELKEKVMQALGKTCEPELVQPEAHGQLAAEEALASAKEVDSNTGGEDREVGTEAPAAALEHAGASAIDPLAAVLSDEVCEEVRRWLAEEVDAVAADGERPAWDTQPETHNYYATRTLNARYKHIHKHDQRDFAAPGATRDNQMRRAMCGTDDCHGLIHALRYHSDGSARKATVLLAALAERIDLGGEVVDELLKPKPNGQPSARLQQLHAG